MNIISILMMAEEYFSATEEDEEIKVFNINDRVIDKKDNNTFFIKVSFREVITYTTSWCFNRSINQEKVDEIYKSLCTSYTIPFILHGVYDERHLNPIAKILILDGQHRIEAIRRYIENDDSDWNCDYNVWICIYKIDNAETNNTSTVIELFKKINNNRIFSEAELPDTFVIDLVKSICEIPLFKKHKVIGTNILTSHCHSPCIHKKELNALFNANKDVIKTKNIKELVINIQKINHKISVKPYEELYLPKYRVAEKAKYQKAVSKCFFLNLKNCTMTPDVWIKYLTDPELLK